MRLPTQITQAKKSHRALKVLIHGESGVGKTTFASKFPRPVFLCTEAGTGHIDSFDCVIETWPEFLAACKSLSAAGHGFETIVLDTVDNALSLCRDYVNKKNKIEHEQDLPFGKGTSMVLREFERELTRLSKLGLGLVLITHTSVEEISDSRQRQRTRFVSAVPKKFRKLLNELVDVVLFATIESTEAGDRRVLRVDSSLDYAAKDRTGRLPPVLSLDYQEFAGCFPATPIEPDTKPAIVSEAAERRARVNADLKRLVVEIGGKENLPEDVHALAISAETEDREKAAAMMSEMARSNGSGRPWDKHV